MNGHSVPDPLPLVAVVIPAYNAASTIDATLRSARGQNYAHLEIIVIDDGSTDETAEIVDGHRREDQRVRLVLQEQQGVAAARNRGTSETRADFIAMLDADDLWHPEKIKRQMRAIAEAGEACGLVYTFSATIDENDEVIDCGDMAGRRAYQGFVLGDLLLNNFIANGSSPLLRKSAMTEVGGYDPDLRAQGAEGCEDLKLYLAIAEDRTFAAVPLPLTGYRVTKTSMSSNVARMIRSHRIVTEPYRESYPDQVRLGRVYLALYYAGREFAAGNYSTWVWALREAARTDFGATVRTVARTLLRHVAPPKRNRGARAGLAKRVLFPAARVAEPRAVQGRLAD
ncbi:glycosyltransferase family 2 protein [Rubellimicrobium rubrum]|nr:glycosyltransferase family 2 protein [Rubellimicrobium rubrum]